MTYWSTSFAVQPTAAEQAQFSNDGPLDLEAPVDPGIYMLRHSVQGFLIDTDAVLDGLEWRINQMRSDPGWSGEVGRLVTYFDPLEDEWVFLVPVRLTADDIDAQADPWAQSGLVASVLPPAWPALLIWFGIALAVGYTATVVGTTLEPDGFRKNWLAVGLLFDDDPDPLVIAAATDEIKPGSTGKVAAATVALGLGALYLLTQNK